MTNKILTGIISTLSYIDKVLIYAGQKLIYHFPNKDFYKLDNLVFKEEEMGESIITCDLSIPADVDPAFSFDWYIELKGEKFYNKTLLPPARKNTESLKYVYSMTFVSERHDLQRDPFANLVTTSEEQPRTEYVFSFYADIAQFADRFNLNLAACLGDRWTMVVSDGVTSSTELISCDNIKLWDLLKSVYDIYGLRWRIYYDADLDKMVIRILNETTDAIEIDHEFEYGANNGLIEIERLNPTEKITTRLSGRGGIRNIPPSYFHDATSGYPADPDANIHTKATYYTNLMPKCYRDYVKGWNGTALSPETPAYTQGVADKALGVWNPVDYIDSANLPVYGRWKDVLEDNTEIYPTIQGITDPVLGRLDEVVDVEAVLNDDYDEEDSSDTGHYNDIQTISLSQFCNPSETPSNNIITSSFVIDNAVNKTSFNIVQTPNIIDGTDIDYSSQIAISLLDESTHAVVDTVVFNGVVISPNIKALYFDGVFSNEPLGTYILQMDVQVANGDYTINVTTELNTIKVYNYANPDTSTQYKQTFDIWVKNIWGSTYQDAGHETETPAEYVSRIWDALTPTNIQGEMTVMWSSGLLASEDYEFVVHEINYDDSKTNSHWRLTLVKSDAELEATDKYLPNKNINAIAGNYFFFTNIILPQTYVLSAETNVENYISAELAKVDTEMPTYSAKPSKIFCASFSEIDKLRVGSRIRLKDTRLIGATSAGYYISSLTMTYTKESILPDWEIVITDKVSSVGNSISRLEGDVKRLSNGVYSNEQQATILAKQFDRYFLRKDGLSQSSESPTTFNKDVTIAKNLLSDDFRQGELTGDGFGLFRDASGNSVLEVDRMNIRKTLTVNELIINQVTFYGGKYLYSAAGMEAVRVEDTGTAYRVYMDTKQGTRLNQFVVNDQAFCQRFAPTDNTVINYYWRLVTAVGSDYIELSKADYDTGSGIPHEGDNIAQVGNRVVTNRQSVLIIDQLTGGSVVQYAGIDGYSWTSKNYVGYGVNPSTGQAYLYCYGDIYCGDRDMSQEDSTWLTFQKKEGDTKRKLYLKGQMNFTSNSSGLYNLSEWPDVDQRIKDAAAYRINLTPDNTSVPCTYEGVVIGDLPTSQAEVYTGSILDTGWAFTGIFDGCDGTVGLSTGLITITSLTADNASVEITATKTGYPTLAAIFGITKVRAGGDGQDAVIYFAEPSVNIIKISKDGTITPISISCEKMKQVGSSAPAITTEKILKYQVSGSSEAAYSGAITIVNTWNYMDFILYDTNGTTVLDKERVPIVIDGVDGKSGCVVVLTPTKQVFNYSAEGVLTDSGAWFVVSTVYNAPTGTLYYEWLVNGESVQNSTASAYGLIPPANYANMPVVYKVNVRVGSTSSDIIATDLVTIYGIKPGANGTDGADGADGADGTDGTNGKDAYTVVLSNETHALPATYGGDVSSYANSGTDVMVWLGTTQIPYGTGNSTFDVLATPANITTGTASTVSTYIRRFADHSNMTSDNASILYTVRVRDSAGTEVVFSKTQTFVKAKAGIDGTVGYEYLAEAIQDGSTSIEGGLILSNIMLLRNISGIVTAGMSGMSNNPLFLFANDTDAFNKALVGKATLSLRRDGTGNLGNLQYTKDGMAYRKRNADGTLGDIIVEWRSTPVPSLADLVASIDITVNYLGGSQSYNSGLLEGNFGMSSNVDASSVTSFVLTITGSIEAEKVDTNVGDSPSSAIVNLNLYEYVGGEYLFVRTINSAAVYNETGGTTVSDTVSVNTTLNLAGGIYAVKAEYSLETRNSNVIAYASVSSISLHAEGASANPCMIFGSDGFVRIKDGYNYDYLTEETASFGRGSGRVVKLTPTTSENFMKVTGSVDMSGVLAAGYVSSTGTLGSNPLGKASSASRTSTGLYTVNHNIGHTNYYVGLNVFNPSSNLTIYTTSKSNTSFTVKVINPHTDTLTDNAFEFSVYGSNA